MIGMKITRQLNGYTIYFDETGKRFEGYKYGVFAPDERPVDGDEAEFVGDDLAECLAYIQDSDTAMVNA